MTTLDNNLDAAPEMSKPGFDSLSKLISDKFSELLDDYKDTIEALEDKNEELATTKAELAACKEQLKAKEELMAAMEREVEQIVGEDQLKQLKFKIRFEHLKKTKTVDEVWAELPEENKNVLLDMMIAKQASKGKPLACVTNAQQTPPGA